MKKSPSLLYVRLQIFHDNTELIMNSSRMSFCKTSTLSTLTNIPMAFLPSIKKLYYSQCFGGLTPSRRPHGIYSSRSEFIISSRALCLNRVWVLASCKLAALIFTCIYPMVSTMTSYSSLTSRRIFVSRQHSTESDFEFFQLQWPKYSWRAAFSSSAKQCLLSVNLKPFLMQTEQQTQERRIVNPRRGRFDTEKSSGARTPTWNSTAQATKMETASTNSGAEGTSLNEFRMLKYFKSKWKRFWIISLNIWANIAGTKHDLLADEPYRPRLLGFHCLHVNATKCIFVGFSLSKLQSFFWKISLNSHLIRLEGFNNKISLHRRVCSTWPSGKCLAQCVRGPGIDSGSNLFLFASFLFFSSFFLFLFL